LKKEIALLEMDAYLKGNKTLNLFADAKRENLKQMFEDGTGLSFTESVAIVEKNQGFQINTRQTTVLKFYTYLKLIKNGR
jgi:hypothetical protein